MFYRIFRWMAAIALRLFYRHIEVDGPRTLPAGPVLLVSNHTNGLVDPLVAMVVFDRRLTLTGKNVLGRNPLLALLSWGLGMIPFHRPEDHGRGADPRQNVLSMRRCRDVFAHGGAVYIFPEGISHSDLKMRPFHVGAARLALDFVRKDGNAGNLQILPVGLHYTSKGRFRSDVCMRIGEPLDAGQWAGNQQQLTAELGRRIKRLTITYQSRREMLSVHWASDIVAAATAPPAASRVTDSLVRLAQLQTAYNALQLKHAEEVEALAGRGREIRRHLKQLGLEPGEVILSTNPLRAMLFFIREMELLIIGLPMAVFGIVNHLLPCLILRGLARRLSSDRDHWATNVIYPGFVIVPLFYAVQLTAAWLMLPALWATIYTIALPCSAYYAVLYGDRVRSVWRRAKAFLFLVRRRSVQQSLKIDIQRFQADLTQLNILRSCS